MDRLDPAAVFFFFLECFSSLEELSGVELPLGDGSWPWPSSPCGSCPCGSSLFLLGLVPPEMVSRPTYPHEDLPRQCAEQSLLQRDACPAWSWQFAQLCTKQSQTSSALEPWTHRSATANKTGSEIHAVCGYCRSLTAFSNSICTFALGCPAAATFRGVAVVDDLGFWAGPRDVHLNARGVQTNGGELVTLGPFSPPAWASSLSCPSCPSSLSSWTAWSENGCARGVQREQHWTVSVAPVPHPLAQWKPSTLVKVHLHCCCALEAATLSKTCAQKNMWHDFWGIRIFFWKVLYPL